MVDDQRLPSRYKILDCLIGKVVDNLVVCAGVRITAGYTKLVTTRSLGATGPSVIILVPVVVERSVAAGAGGGTTMTLSKSPPEKSFGIVQYWQVREFLLIRL